MGEKMLYNMFWSTVILMPFVEQIVEYAKTSDKRGVTVDFLGIMTNRNFAFKIVHRQTMTMEETTITMTKQKDMQMS
jgi:hypothetical protein